MSESQDHRTVLLLGRTGNGKSTCANVIAGCDSDDPEQQLFRESETAVSETKDIHEKTIRIEWRRQTYHVTIVDTIGIGDTALPKEEVLKSLSTICSKYKGGLSSVFFLVKGRMTKEEADALDIICKVLFTPQICTVTTLIRTNFPGFMMPNKVSADIAALEQDEPGRKVMSMVSNVIHIDNPPLIYPHGKETRAQSREALLAKIVLSEQVYKPPEIAEVNKRISNYLEETATAEEKIARMEAERVKAQKELEIARKEAAANEERARLAREEADRLRQENALRRQRISHTHHSRSGCCIS
ncbi:uncharacterized protein LOC134183516 [Corticium candelabrum]|uniref:uncharacterized protein LOC134183516 n=1 Tax=Corticium candelabrum TaxID=121492 RepID=UPI002E26A3C1|nr:uncharacterized protein LOC134183516 [Corticium candelabrum]